MTNENASEKVGAREAREAEAKRWQDFIVLQVPVGRYLSDGTIERRVYAAAKATPGVEPPPYYIIQAALLAAMREGKVFRTSMASGDWGYARPTDRMRQERAEAEAKRTARAEAYERVTVASTAAAEAFAPFFGEDAPMLSDGSVTLSGEQAIRLLVLAGQPVAANALRVYVEAAREHDALCK